MLATLSIRLPSKAMQVFEKALKAFKEYFNLQNEQQLYE